MIKNKTIKITNQNQSFFNTNAPIQNQNLLGKNGVFEQRELGEVFVCRALLDN